MSDDYDDDQAIEDAIQAAREDERRGSEDDPPEDYLMEEAGRRAQWHRRDAHGGAKCDCSTAPVVYAEEAPF